jgi:hypothetical protein
MQQLGLINASGSMADADIVPAWALKVLSGRTAA